MSSYEAKEQQLQLLHEHKAQLELAIAERFREHREAGKHKPGVKALSKKLRCVKRRIRELTYA
jgi:hypothetical protein